MDSSGPHRLGTHQAGTSEPGAGEPGASQFRTSQFGPNLTAGAFAGRFVGDDARAHLAEAVDRAEELAFALDFDGTLAPIMDHPDLARMDPRAQDPLQRLSSACGALAIITGRPVAQVIEYGALAGLGARVAAGGGVLHVFGQYGAEHWSTEEPEIRAPVPAPGIAELAGELPGLIAAAGVPGAWVEDKGLALVVHTRNLPDPELALARLEPSLHQAAVRLGLDVEPGRLVLELRSPGPDKGQALARLLQETGTRGAVFVGDDRGDLPAWSEVLARREQGNPGLSVLSSAPENQALVPACDLVVDGVGGVVRFLEEFASAASLD